MKVDPKKITKFDRTQADLEWFLFFCISTAGKNAEVQSRKINEMIDQTQKMKVYQDTGIYSIPNAIYYKCHYENWETKIPSPASPKTCSEWIAQASNVFKIGKYDLIRKSSKFIIKNGIHHRLDSVTLEELLKIPGVGNKTARFFLMHSRPGFTGAVIDTHIHGWLEKVCQTDLPKPTTTAKYQSLERLWLSMVEIFFPGEPLHVADLATWILMRSWPKYDPFQSDWDPCLKIAINQAKA